MLHVHYSWVLQQWELQSFLLSLSKCIYYYVIFHLQPSAQKDSWGFDLQLKLRHKHFSIDSWAGQLLLASVAWSPPSPCPSSGWHPAPNPRSPLDSFNTSTEKISQARHGRWMAAHASHEQYPKKNTTWFCCSSTSNCSTFGFQTESACWIQKAFCAVLLYCVLKVHNRHTTPHHNMFSPVGITTSAATRLSHRAIGQCTNLSNSFPEWRKLWNAQCHSESCEGKQIHLHLFFLRLWYRELQIYEHT